MSVDDYTEKELKLFKKLLKFLGTEDYKVTLRKATAILNSERVYKRKTYIKKAIQKFVSDSENPIERKADKLFRTDL